MKSSHVLILIPARFASLRFPGKPLAIIKGKSLIERVYRGCSFSSLGTSSLLFDVAVVTDDARIEQHVLSFGGHVCRVDDDVPSGSERLALAYQRFYKNKNYDLIINVQGDEPLVHIDDLIKIAKAHLENDRFDIFTLVRKINFENKDHGLIRDHNIVKVALGHFKEGAASCLYFSRAAIPYSREETKGVAQDWHWHIGVYSYRPKALESFFKLPVGYTEKLEKLEQLRALENGLLIGAVETLNSYVGVDTPADILKVEGVLNESGAN